jgi:hypothetical protein
MNNHRPSKVVAFIAILIYLAVPQWPFHAVERNGLTAFPDFVTAVVDGQADVIRGVYAPGVFAFPVIQQAANDPGFVSETRGVVTQFGPAAQNNVVGLLSHNTLAGASFSNLTIGQEIRLVYGDGQVEYFVVKRLARYQVLQAKSQIGNYLDLSTNKILSTQELFATYYQGAGHVTFQTCIRMGDEASWGRLFVLAIPVPDTFLRGIQLLKLAGMLDDSTAIKALELFGGNAVLK